MHWPNGKHACICVTMDNMGEAADIHRGLWPSSQPVGSHFSVTEKLPIMLDLLDKHSIKATYFIEGWNMTVYPDTIKHIQQRGHEIGFHAYQHEVWSLLDPETEIANLEKSVTDAGEIGIKFRGFRPPGGIITPQTLRLMREQAMTYLSPAAERPAIVDGIAMVPFQWESIDAYFYLKATASLRKGKGDTEDVIGPDEMKERLVKRIDEVVKEGGFLALLFHPFLQTDKRKMEVMEEVLKHVVSKEDVWVAQCQDVGDWIRENPNSFSNDPGWDKAEWKKK
ncbi:carbohydrate esterase family 4 protein [Mycena floridula]|nr:carbohydrate esterase family 4 protein [Mycena floridula]